MKSQIFLLFSVVALVSCEKKREQVFDEPSAYYSEPHRPQLHFTPPAKWMNDPNGMVYHDGEYHLFYQHYPEGDVWGPMHWGHAISTDLLHWEHLPIALYPDSLGMIFSGSTVVDEKNTSGLGTAKDPPMVAIFTYHFAEGERNGRVDYQTQGLAFSVDKGRTWKKYDHNPVLKNPGIKDFRDPKVFWHEASEKWIMILAVLDHVELYGSPDLKSWTKLSDFGKDYGSHGGVWECPDLFPLAAEGEKKWVMLLSINPGGPNGGSGTQYFIGDFDGAKFICETEKRDTLWLDHGPDNYAGVTWSNIGNQDGRRIFLGWMSNWAYANVVPTSPWRSAMTFPRELKLKKANQNYRVTSTPVNEIEGLSKATKQFSDIQIDDSLDLAAELDFPPTRSLMKGTVEAKGFTIELSNNRNQRIGIGYEAGTNRYFIDRGASGKTGFSDGFNAQSFAPRISNSSTINFTIITDVSSVEVFFDDGLTNLTSLFFPDEKFDQLVMKVNSEPVDVSSLEVIQLSSVWQNVNPKPGER